MTLPRESASRSHAFMLLGTWLCGAGFALSFGGADSRAVDIITGACLVLALTLMGRGISGSWRGSLRMGWPILLVGALALIYRLALR